MSKSKAAQEREAVTGVLVFQPGITAYLVSAASGLSVTKAMAALAALEKTGVTRHEDDLNGARWYLTGNEPGNEPGPENRTGDEKMTPPKSPVAKARAKYLAAAKRSLKLIIDGATAATGSLDKRELPASFAASVRKYDEALAALAALSALETDGGEVLGDGTDDGIANPVLRADLQGMIAVLTGFGIPVTVGTPLSRLAAAAQDPPWDPEPEPVPPPDAPEPE